MPETKKCACGCGKEISDRFNYAHGHKPKSGAPKQPPPELARLRAARAEVPVGLLLVEPDDELVDKIWERLSLPAKVKALNSLRQ